MDIESILKRFEKYYETKLPVTQVLASILVLSLVAALGYGIHLLTGNLWLAIGVACVASMLLINPLAPITLLILYGINRLTGNLWVTISIAFLWIFLNWIYHNIAAEYWREQKE